MHDRLYNSALLRQPIYAGLPLCARHDGTLSILTERAHWRLTWHPLRMEVHRGLMLLPRISGSVSHDVVRIVFAITLIVGTVCSVQASADEEATTANPPAPTASGFRLEIPANAYDQNAFDIEFDPELGNTSLSSIERTSDSATDPPDTSNKGLTLESLNDWKELPKLDLQLDLREGHTSALERHVMSEMAHAREGGLVGSSERAALMFDLVGIVQSIRNAIKERRKHRSSPGSQITRDRELTLLVHEADGSVPENISVIPLTDGYVGDALGASCNPDGRCRLSGLPTQESTLLVRGSGAALIRLNSPHPEAAVRLHPVVKLRIRPTSTWEHGAIRYRLISDSIDGTVPIIRWLNPDRDSWFEVPAHGLSLYLPSGDYRLEVAADDSPLRVIPIHLDSEDFVEVALD